MQVPKRKPNPYDLVEPDPYMSREAIAKLEADKAKLLRRRPKVIEEMQLAAQDGDFSENHPYQAAKARLRGINSRIARIEAQLNRAIPIEEGAGDTVRIGSTVTVEVNGNERTYQILGSHEADPSAGKISHRSPVGSLLMGKKVGDEVSGVINENEMTYKIINIY